MCPVNNCLLIQLTQKSHRPCVAGDLGVLEALAVGEGLVEGERQGHQQMLLRSTRLIAWSFVRRLCPRIRTTTPPNPKRRRSFGWTLNTSPHQVLCRSTQAKG